MTEPSSSFAVVGERFPQFELVDLAGRGWSAADLVGQRTILFCFASWCICKEQLPSWQTYWESRGRDFQMLAAIFDAKGAETAAPTVEASGAEFPVLLDTTSSLGAAVGAQMVPLGIFIDAEGTVAMADISGTFEIGDPRVRVNVDRFLAGEVVEQPEAGEAMEPRALELFAEGVIAYHAGDRERALELWRDGLQHDPDNFIIRSQIWTLEHPEHFWPEVDRAWQEQQLAAEGYDKPLP